MKDETAPLERKPNREILVWLDEVRKIQQPILDRQGFLPDSTPEIAEDRQRSL
jgi:hypothetical protein